ncbi:MAG: MFS transporter, partial [Pseudonocardia sp.]
MTGPRFPLAQALSTPGDEVRARLDAYHDAVAPARQALEAARAALRRMEDNLLGEPGERDGGPFDTGNDVGAMSVTYALFSGVFTVGVGLAWLLAPDGAAPLWMGGVAAAVGSLAAVARGRAWLAKRLSARWEEPARLLRERDFRLFLGGLTVSVLGNAVQRFAQDWLVLDLTDHDGFALGVVMALQYLPSGLMLWAGKRADRKGGRGLFTFTQAGLALTTLVLGLATVSSMVTLPLVYAVSLVSGALIAMAAPTEEVFFKDLVGRDRLYQAGGLTNTALNGARIGGPALAALLIGGLGVGWLVVLNAASYAVMVVALRRMGPVGARGSPASDVSAPAESATLLGYLRAQPVLRVMLGMLLLVASFGMATEVTLPLLAVAGLGGQVGSYGALAIALGAGAAAGSLWTAGRRDPPSVRFVVGTAAALGAAEVLAGLFPSLAVAVVAVAAVGLFINLYIVSVAAWALLFVPDSVSGRVMGLFMLLVRVGTPVSAPLFGWAGNQLGGRVPIMLAGAVTVMTTTAAAAWLGWLRHRLAAQLPAERVALNAALGRLAGASKWRWDGTRLALAQGSRTALTGARAELDQLAGADRPAV